MAMMKAVTVKNYGGPEVIAVGEMPRPTPGAGEILVKVVAASVNPVDYKTREGYLKDFVKYPLPFVPGWDLSGVVEALGPGVAGFARGDAVFGMTHFKAGAFAEYAVLPADAAVKKPANLDHRQAAAVPLASLTAWQTLFRGGNLKSNQTVLINGAAGAVGAFAVQFARQVHAFVVGAARAHDLDFVRSLGADQAIDLSAEPPPRPERPVDLVFDTVSGDIQNRSAALLSPGGLLITIAGPTPETSANKTIRSAYHGVELSGHELQHIAKMIAEGALKQRIGPVFPMSAARQAFEAVEKGGTNGKVILDIAP